MRGAPVTVSMILLYVVVVGSGLMLARSGPPRRRKRLARVSAKRRRANRERNRRMIATFGETPACAAQLAGCTGWADDAHELLSRARGGSITDPDNVMPLCRSCHRVITDHPAWAQRLGLSRPSGGDAA